MQLNDLIDKMSEYDYTFKLMMLGDASVDKTSLILRYISGYLMQDLKLTLGVDFYSKTIIFNGRTVKLQIWDFGGEERFRFLLSQYCRGARGAFFLYDITNPMSLERLPEWTQIVRENAGDIPIMLVGSKSHSDESQVVSRQEGISVAENYNLSAFVEICTETGQNVEHVFELLTELLFEGYGQNNYYSTTAHQTETRGKIHPKSLRKSQIFFKCIYCGRRLDRPGREYTSGNIKVKELRFCCNCFNKFRGKTLAKLPASVIKTIENNIKRYRGLKD